MRERVHYCRWHWKHCGKWHSCLTWAIFHFQTVVSTLYSKMFLSDVFKASKIILTLSLKKTPLQQTAFWKHSDKRRNCLKQAISPFATMFSTFSNRLFFQLSRFLSIFWKKYVQSCLLQNCHMRERVVRGMVVLQQMTFKSFRRKNWQSL